MAVALRFPTLGDQSFWRDEASTAIELNGSFGHLMRSLADFEGMPPGYFALAWLWSRAFGLGEAGLRSLSAVVGVATVPAAWALARALRPSAAAPAAFLVAASPLLVWYSQEARPYALLVLVTTLMTLFWVRDRRAAWGLAAAAALLVHYFAIFLVAPQAVVMLRRGARRELIPAAACGLALAPLVAAQTDARVDWVTDTSLGSRLADVGKHFATGAFGTPVNVLGVLAVLALAAGAVLGARGRARAVLATAGAAAALPVLLALLGADYVLDRYLIATLVPLLAVVAAGLPRAAGAGLVVLFAVFTITAATDRSLQREDWRDVARRLPANTIVVASPDAVRPLQWYARGRIRGPQTHAVEDVVAVAAYRSGRPRPQTPPPPAGFALLDRRDDPATTEVRYHRDGAQVVDPRTLLPQNLDPRTIPRFLYIRQCCRP